MYKSISQSICTTIIPGPFNKYIFTCLITALSGTRSLPKIASSSAAMLVPHCFVVHKVLEVPCFADPISGFDQC